MSTLTESQRDGRAVLKLMREQARAGHSGLSFRVNTKRCVVHVAIHNVDGIGFGLTFGEADFDSLAEKFLQSIREPETLPTVARLLRHESWQQRAQVDRMSGELQTLRWRIMHLEREAAERVPAYSDTTALVLAAAPAAVRTTEREMEFRDDRGSLRFGLVDDEKGCCLPFCTGGPTCEDVQRRARRAAPIATKGGAY